LEKTSQAMAWADAAPLIARGDHAAWKAAMAAVQRAERRFQAGLLRDIVGNPFRPAALDPKWRTPAVVGLAQRVYFGRAFDQMPAIAVALEKAGYTDGQVVSHCRGAGPHAKGCWVLDLLLDKK